MSIKRMSAVWDKSEAKGSQLLLLLAIADHAGDDGFAWPGIKRLADKIRMSARQTMRLVVRLEQDKELYVERDLDQGAVNRYIVLPGLEDDQILATLQDRLHKSPEEADRILADLRGGDNLSGVTTCQGGGDIAMSGGGDIAMSPEPSITVTEPKEEEDALDSQWSKVYTLWQSNINLSESPITIQEMKSEEYLKLPYEWWEQAIKIACDNKARRWSYVRGVLDRSIDQGLAPNDCTVPKKYNLSSSQKKGHSTHEVAAAKTKLSPEQAALAAELARQDAAQPG